MRQVKLHLANCWPAALVIRLRRIYWYAMRRLGFYSMAMVALMLGGGLLFRVQLANWVETKVAGVTLSTRKTLYPDPQKYAVLVAELERWRTDLAKRHAAAKNQEERKTVEQDARVILETVLPAMMRCWLGTPWDYNGTAAKPGDGSVACGYFVATVLKDAGFQLNRYRLAQQPSENILRTFLPKSACSLTIGQKYKNFAANLEKSPPGIYLIGLDTHVAFLVVESGSFRMIHASGSRPWCVVDEPRDHAPVLEKSNWRMIGNLTGDARLVRRWLLRDKFDVHGT